MIYFAVVYAVQKGDSSCFDSPITYIVTVFPLMMSIVPRSLFEGWVPLTAIFFKMFGSLFCSFRINRLYQWRINVVIPLVYVVPAR